VLIHNTGTLAERMKKIVSGKRQRFEHSASWKQNRRRYFIVKMMSNYVVSTIEVTKSLQIMITHGLTDVG
jgi:hypothetical protein